MILVFTTLDSKKIAAQACLVSTIEEFTMEAASVSSRSYKTCTKVVMANGHEYLTEEAADDLVKKWRKKLRTPPTETADIN